MSGGGLQRGLLETLQQHDYDIEAVIVHSKFVVAYVLQQDGPNPGWRKANIEGPVYLVRRRTSPKYQLFVKNEFSTNDRLDDLHPDWELDCQKNYVFYRIEDTSKPIRGLWFHDDAERQKLEAALEKTLDELRKEKFEAANEERFRPEKGPSPGPVPGPSPQAQNQDRATVSREGLRSAFHALAEDPGFLDTVMQKLRERH
jgi:hypothetical protein